MKPNPLASALAPLAMLGAIASAPASAQSTPPATLPSPALTLWKTELYTANGKQWVRYSFDVTNKAQYPDALFAASPDLPPCGLNTKSARTWIDFYAADGKRLYGFCALGKAADLGSIWFSTAKGTPPPAQVYIEITDRLTHTKYKSNLAATAL